MLDEQPQEQNDQPQPEQDAQPPEGAGQPTDGADSDADGAAKEPAQRTYTQEEWSKRESALNQQTAELSRKVEDAAKALEKAQQDAQKAQQQKVEEELAQMERSYLERFGEDPEARKAVQDFTSKTRDVLKADAELRQAKSALDANMSTIQENHRKATALDLSLEYHVPVKALLDAECKNPSEMRLKAQQLQHEQKMEELEQTKQKPKKYDSSTRGKSGVKIDEMTDDELIKYGLELEAQGRRPVA